MEEVLIHHAITHKLDWFDFLKNHNDELEEVFDLIDEFENNHRQYSNKFFHDFFSEKKKIYWQKPSKNYLLGHIKDKVSFYYEDNYDNKPDLINRLLIDFRHAQETNIVDKSVLIFKDNRSIDYDHAPDIFNEYYYYDILSSEIKRVFPINLDVKFILLFIQRPYSKYERYRIGNLLKLKEVQLDENIAIDKSIEFPPELYHAGVGILNYFSTYLKKNKVCSKTTVRIEQGESKVRMIVLSEYGQKTVIEKAFEEFNLIVTGQNDIEEFTDNIELVLEFRNKLRIAQVELDYQKDINLFLKSQNQNLQQMLLAALNKENPSIDVTINPKINFNPTITSTNTNSQNISFQLYEVHDLLNELKTAANTKEQKQEIEKVANLVEEAIKDPTKKVDKKKNFISKLKGLSENITQGMGVFTKSADATEKAAKSANKLYQLGEKLIPYIDQLMQIVS